MSELVDMLWDVPDVPWKNWRDPRHHEVWDAPEVLLDHPQTFKVDVWSFAMVMIEVFTDKQPWSEFRWAKRGRSSIMMMLYSEPDVRPTRPKDEDLVTDEVWDLIQDCWKTNPDERPDFVEIHRRLEKAEAAFNEKQSSLSPEVAPAESAQSSLLMALFGMRV